MSMSSPPPQLEEMQQCGVFWHPPCLSTHRRQRTANEILYNELSPFYTPAKCVEILLPLIGGDDEGAIEPAVEGAVSDIPEKPQQPEQLQPQQLQQPQQQGQQQLQLHKQQGQEQQEPSPHKKNMPESSGTCSLRALDWLVINYAKKHRITYMLRLPGKAPQLFDVFQEYKMCLLRYKRINFDPFRRGRRVYFQLNGNRWYETTVGQLNFIHWASIYGVLDFARANNAAIVKDHVSSLAQHAKLKAEDEVSGKGRKRKELSRRSDVDCVVYTMCTEIVFNNK